MYAFQYHRPESVADAASSYRSGEAKLLASGHAAADHEAAARQP